MEEIVFKINLHSSGMHLKSEGLSHGHSSPLNIFAREGLVYILSHGQNFGVGTIQLVPIDSPLDCRN